MQSPPSSSRDPTGDSLETIVAEYLRVLGFSKTLLELDCESKELRIRDPKADPTGSNRASRLLNHAYEQSYSEFRTWVLSAIDIFRTELNMLSFPVFAIW